MRANRRRDTAPEIALRRVLHAWGYRFRVDLPIRPDEGRLIRPDLTFTRAKLAVFVDGCYWHGCPEHGRRDGGANTSYWGPKIARNQERDVEQGARLERSGWTVVRIWEHDDTEAAARRVAEIVDLAGGRRRSAAGPRSAS